VFTRVTRWTYLAFAWIILAAVIAQFFLAGLGVFAGGSNFDLHRDVGYTLSFVMLFGLLVAFAARLPWRIVGLTALLPLLVVLQSVFIVFWHDGVPAVAALHVVNGLAIFSLAGFLAVRSKKFIVAEKSTSQPTSGEAEALAPQ
jgi:hypothetical protein